MGAAKISTRDNWWASHGRFWPNVSHNSGPNSGSGVRDPGFKSWFCIIDQFVIGQVT